MKGFRIIKQKTHKNDRCLCGIADKNNNVY